MKHLVLLSLVLSLCYGLTAQTEEAKKLLNEKQAMELAKVLAREDPFLEGPDMKFAPESIGKFFKKEIYTHLKGNPFMGYYHEEGGAYKGSKQKTIWLDVVSGFEKTKPWHKVIRKAMEKLAEVKGYKLEPESPNRVGLYAITVHPEKTKTSHPGIVAEIYIQNRENGSVLYTRQYEGNLKGPEAAILSVCDYIYYLIENEKKLGKEK